MDKRNIFKSIYKKYILEKEYNINTLRIAYFIIVLLSTMLSTLSKFDLSVKDVIIIFIVLCIATILGYFINILILKIFFGKFFESHQDFEKQMAPGLVLQSIIFLVTNIIGVIFYLSHMRIILFITKSLTLYIYIGFVLFRLNKIDKSKIIRFCLYCIIGILAEHFYFLKAAFMLIR